MIKDLALDLAKVTENAALKAAKYIGCLDKNMADQAGVDGMRQALSDMDIDGQVVIGEGEIDEAPMLYIGEKVGLAREGSQAVDIAVDPVEGTNLVASAARGSIAVMVLAPKGTLLHAPDMYMEKIASGPEGRGLISLDKSVEENLKALAKAKGQRVEDLVVAVLDRERHEKLIGEIRKAGARVHLFSDGDVETALASCFDTNPIDMIMGIGGAPEGVLACAAVKAIGGHFEARLAPRSDEEVKRCKEMGIEDVEKILTMDDLVNTDQAMFASTGITDGSFLDGVKFLPDGRVSLSTLIINKSDGIRFINSIRHL